MTIFSNEAKPGFMSYARIVDKLDEHMGRRDYAGAERHLRYWLEEMLALDDRRGELAVRNELVGHFRKTGNQDEAIEQGEAVLALVDELDFGNTISAATTCVNVATAFSRDACPAQAFACGRAAGIPDHDRQRWPACAR